MSRREQNANELVEEESTPSLQAAHIQQESQQGVKIVEREISLTLLNDKINYAIGLLENLNNGVETILTKGKFK